jgi:biotin carboxyl carrier protein
VSILPSDAAPPEGWNFRSMPGFRELRADHFQYSSRRTDRTGENMSKNQRRGNREARKPKSVKAPVIATTAKPFAAKGNLVEPGAKKPKA